MTDTPKTEITFIPRPKEPDPQNGDSTQLVEFFDPPMCCPSGLCGPTLDQTLLDLNELVLALKAEGLRVERYQMASHPQVFIKHPEVMRLVRERSLEALPITLVGGRVIKQGAYPTRQEIDQALLEVRGTKQ